MRKLSRIAAGLGNFKFQNLTSTRTGQKAPLSPCPGSALSLPRPRDFQCDFLFEGHVMNLLRLGLQPRLYSGFGVLVLLGLLLAGFATWQLSAIAAQVGKMTALNDNVTRALEVAEQLQIQRRSALRYTIDADEAS